MEAYVLPKRQLTFKGLYILLYLRNLHNRCGNLEFSFFIKFISKWYDFAKLTSLPNSYRHSLSHDRSLIDEGMNYQRIST
jgi:hypothetical protein